MARDYSIKGTTKLQHEKTVDDAYDDAIALDTPEPSSEMMQLMRDYVDGKREISEVLDFTISRYKAANA